MNSCTSALECALKIINKKGEVIIPSWTWVSTANAVLNTGNIPVFADVEINSRNITASEIKKKITKKTKAIFIAHLIGFPSDIKRIKKIIGKKKIKILEDCCESQGASIKNKNIGNFGIAGSFSFYWGHHMSTIEGGMITTNDKKFYNLCLLKRSHGLARELPKKDQSVYKKKIQKKKF